MPEMILGLDIGDNAVKVVLASFRGRHNVRIMAAATEHLSENFDLEAALTKIVEKIQPFLSARPSCIVSVPPSLIMFRHVRLPFSDDSKIRKTLFFELESLLPLPVEEVVADYISLPGQGLLAAVCQKDKIRKIIAAVEACLGDVLAIDVAATILALPLLEEKALSGCGIILDIGASSTSALFYEQNSLIQIRSFAFGGNNITHALAEDLSLCFQEAEQIKISNPEAAKTEGTEHICQKFCFLLANTIEFMKLNDMLASAPSQIMLTGGGSLFLPLGEELTKQLGIPICKLDLSLSGRTDIEGVLKKSYIPAEMNTALAAAKRIFFSRKSYNFRQGEFAAPSVLGGFKKQLKLGACLTAILFLLAACNIFLSYQWQVSRTAELKKQISAIFKKHYPPSAVMVDPVLQLKTKLADNRKMYGMESGTAGATALETLRDLSGFIGPGIDILVTSLHYENGKILLKGEAKKIDDVTHVKNELLKSKYFKNVVIGSTALAKEGDKVNFDLRIEL